MFYYLEGIVALTERNFVVIDVAGAGYACQTTTTTLSRLNQGKTAKLYTYCHIKEDAFDIYGFYDIAEKRCFELLLSVTGVGPKAALSILSASTPGTLAIAVACEDERALIAAPGVGRKLAQRIILELKGKLEHSAFSNSDDAPIVLKETGNIVTKYNEIGAALEVLGFNRSEITHALRGIAVEEMSVEDVVRTVLKNSVK